MNYCRDPKIFTFSTLKDQYKSEAIENLLAIQNKWEVIGIDSIIGAIKVAKFNNTLYNQMKHFLTEFSTRKNLKIPIDL
jgi:C-terminal processing protease CtpA/Prc